MAVRLKSMTVIPHLAQTTEPANTGGFDVYWEIEGNTFTPVFQLQTSDTEDGPWTDVLPAPQAGTFVLNVVRPLVNMQAIRWFRLQVADTLDPLNFLFTSWAMDHRNRMNFRDHHVYREHLRRLRMQLDKKTGIPGWLLRRKITGAPCTDCCDEILGTPTNQECATCFGVGIVGGYWPPVAMMMDWGKEGPPSSANTNNIATGPTQVVQSQAQMFPIPEAKSKDVWFDKGTRYAYEIVQTDPIHFQGSIFIQRPTMTRLPAHHPIYRFVLP